MAQAKGAENIEVKTTGGQVTPHGGRQLQRPRRRTDWGSALAPWWGREFFDWDPFTAMDLWDPLRSNRIEPFRAMEKLADFTPRMDVYEDQNKLHFIAELPGMKKEDVNIDFDDQNHVLTVSGEAKHEYKKEDINYYSSERSFGKFLRRFQLPENVDPSQINAKLEHGVLDLSMPKVQQQQTKQPKKIEIL